jgi:hypothetical protein
VRRVGCVAEPVPAACRSSLHGRRPEWATWAHAAPTSRSHSRSRHHRRRDRGSRSWCGLGRRVLTASGVILMTVVVVAPVAVVVLGSIAAKKGRLRLPKFDLTARRRRAFLIVGVLLVLRDVAGSLISLFDHRSGLAVFDAVWAASLAISVVYVVTAPVRATPPAPKRRPKELTVRQLLASERKEREARER